jgi:hypothetical protein
LKEVEPCLLTLGAYHLSDGVNSVDKRGAYARQYGQYRHQGGQRGWRIYRVGNTYTHTLTHAHSHTPIALIHTFTHTHTNIDIRVCVCVCVCVCMCVCVPSTTREVPSTTKAGARLWIYSVSFVWDLFCGVSFV